MNLKIGIVGLPNAGKSTLFNALTSRKLAETAPRPFTTITPHEAVVPVPDTYLEKLSLLVKPEKTVPSTITFIDIAGLVKDAHKGEGLGNQFLSHIREVDAIVHVVRGFTDVSVPHDFLVSELGSKEQMKDDIELVEIELELGGISKKPVIYVINCDEGGMEPPLPSLNGEVVCLCAKLEEELIDFSEKERQEYLKTSGITHSGLEKLITSSYRLLSLVSFYTIKGGKETHAWSLKKGQTAFDAAGMVHSDFATYFIKAEVVDVQTLISLGGWRQAKEKGRIRLEGKEYKVAHQDVIEFKVGR